jgi:hypothetical protein
MSEITFLDDRANEEGAIYIDLAPTDEDGNAVTPATLAWSLTDINGSLMNDREDVDFESDDGTGSAGVLSTAMTLKLFGNDTALHTTAGSNERVVTFKYTYVDGDGDTVQDNQQIGFYIDDLVNVT